MHGILKRRYNFADISVMMRVSEDRYLDLTGLNLLDDREYIDMKCESEFVLAFCTFCKMEIYAAPVTYEELVMLSRTKSIVRIVTNAFDDEVDAKQMGAQIAAKKILDSAYGVVEQRLEGDEIWYDFKHLLRPKGEDGKRKKVYTAVLSKKIERMV